AKETGHGPCSLIPPGCRVCTRIKLSVRSAGRGTMGMDNLEDRERKHAVHKEHLHREHRYLRRRLEQLNQCAVQTALSV
ncbi:hypothetical protein L9F63_012567, partial [Diploptera punctata]